MNSVKSSFVMFLVACASIGLLSGCASQGTNLTYDSISREFREGSTVLRCDLVCQLVAISEGENLRDLYLNESWEELAKEVIRIGFNEDLHYLYLAKAAERLGFYSASEEYYRLGLSTRFKCGPIVDRCYGTDAQGGLKEGLSRVKEIQRQLANANRVVPNTQPNLGGTTEKSGPTNARKPMQPID